MANNQYGANISNISINYPLPKQSANLMDVADNFKMAKYRLVQHIGLKLDWWYNCAKTHLVGSHLVKADVGVPCSWVNAVLAKVLTHILWCRLWQQSIDTFPETQESWLIHTTISVPDSLHLGISPISDVSRWDPRDIMQATCS